MSKTACMCDFPATCGGTGTLDCTGCGGDACVCAACFGHGEVECPGCGECPVEPDESGWDPVDDG